MSHRPESNHCPTKRSHLSAEPSVPASGTDNSRSRLTVKVFHCLMYRLLFHKPMRHLVWSISCCWFKRICSKCLTVSVSNRFFHRRTRPEGLHVLMCPCPARGRGGAGERPGDALLARRRFLERL